MTTIVDDNEDDDDDDDDGRNYECGMSRQRCNYSSTTMMMKKKFDKKEKNQKFISFFFLNYLSQLSKLRTELRMNKQISLQNSTKKKQGW